MLAILFVSEMVYRSCATFIIGHGLQGYPISVSDIQRVKSDYTSPLVCILCALTARVCSTSLVFMTRERANSAANASLIELQTNAATLGYC